MDRWPFQTASCCVCPMEHNRDQDIVIGNRQANNSRQRQREGMVATLFTQQEDIIGMSRKAPSSSWRSRTCGLIVGNCDNSTGGWKMETEDVELSLVLRCWGLWDVTRMDESSETVIRNCRLDHSETAIGKRRCDWLDCG